MQSEKSEVPTFLPEEEEGDQAYELNEEEDELDGDDDIKLSELPPLTPLTDAEMEDFSNAFSTLDTGTVDVPQVKEMISRMGHPDFTDDDISNIMRLVNPHGKDFTRFVDFMQEGIKNFSEHYIYREPRVEGKEYTDDENAEIERREREEIIYRSYDWDRKGYITRENVVRIAEIRAKKGVATDAKVETERVMADLKVHSASGVIADRIEKVELIEFIRREDKRKVEIDSAAANKSAKNMEGWVDGQPGEVD